MAFKKWNLWTIIISTVDLLNANVIHNKYYCINSLKKLKNCLARTANGINIITESKFIHRLLIADLEMAFNP